METLLTVLSFISTFNVGVLAGMLIVYIQNNRLNK